MISNPSNATWKQLLCPNSGERCFHTSTLYKHYIITYGGRNSQTRTNYNNFSILNLKTRSFEQFKLQGEIPSQRHRHSACLFDDNKILIFGGHHDLILHDAAILTIEETSPLTLTYKKIKTTGGENLVRYNHSADVYNNKMYIFGGRLEDKPIKNTNELWSLDLETFQWELCETTGDIPEKRTTHFSAVYDARLYIFGGYSNSKHMPSPQCHVLSFENMQWKSLESNGLSFFTRFGASTAVIGDAMYIVGGSYTSPGSRQNEVQSYNFKQNILRDEESQGDYPSVRGGTCIAWENQLFLWGGMIGPKQTISQITYLDLNQSDDVQTTPTKKDSFILASLVREFFTEAPNHDIIFEVESELIPAHKWWLIKRSKYFANMFSSGMAEAKSSKITISDFKATTFKAFLEFLYTDSIDLNESLALELFQQADKYSVPALKTLCEQYLSTHISSENYVKIVNLAEMLESSALREAAVAYIAKNIKALKSREDFVEISNDMLRDVIIKITVR